MRNSDWVEVRQTTYFLVTTEQLGRDGQIRQVDIWINEHERDTTLVLKVVQVVETVQQSRQFGNWREYRVMAQGMVAGYSSGEVHVGQ